MIGEEPRCGSTTTVSVAMGSLFTVLQDHRDREPTVRASILISVFILRKVVGSASSETVPYPLSTLDAVPQPRLD